MSDSQTNAFDQLLRSWQETPAVAELPDPEREQLVRRIGTAIRAATPADEAHLSVAKLQALIRACQGDPATWEMPEHLSSCPLCLEIYEILLDGVPLISRQTLNEYAATMPAQLSKSGSPLPLRRSRVSVVFRWSAMAAAVILTAGIGWSLYVESRPVSHLGSGSLKLAEGPSLLPGQDLPNGAVVDATEDSKVAMLDGSEIALDKESRFAVSKSTEGDTTVNLTSGRLSASISHQTPGHHFFVTTPLGQVTVVGTKFTVTLRNEAVTVYENQAGNTAAKPSRGNVEAVVVTVTQGVVRVSNKDKEAKVSAGQTATLYDHPSTIEVTEK